MIWYRPKSNLNKKVSVNMAGSPSLRFAESEVEEIERTPIAYPAVVQVGIPHNVINVTENRYCISFIFLNQDNSRPTMQDSVKIFKNYLISRE
jgi:diaminopimelate epimerase